MEIISDNLKNYMKKLLSEIENPVFSAFGKSLLEKKRIDDTLCLIDINFPEILKKVRERVGDSDRGIKSFRAYQSMIDSIKSKSFMNYYLVNKEQIIYYIKNLETSFNADKVYIEKTYPDIVGI